MSEEMYRIRVKGHLDLQRSSYLGGLTIKHEIDGNSGETILSGPIRDQAALFGVLLKIRDLGLPLLEVIRQSPADKPL